MLVNLKELRTKKGISQQKLADALGLTQQSINKYENQRVEPDIATMMRIADYFETSVDYLIGHTDVRQRIEPLSGYQLNREEARLIDAYRQLNRRERQSLQLVAENYMAK